MTCLNGTQGSGDGEKFVRDLLNYYVYDEIKSDNHENIKLNR